MSAALYFAAVLIWLSVLTHAAWKRDRPWVVVSVLVVLHLWFMG